MTQVSGPSLFDNAPFVSSPLDKQNKSSKSLQLTALQRQIHHSYGFWGSDQLQQAVDAALRITAPIGDPSEIREIAISLQKGAVAADVARADISKVGSQRLPDAWLGATSVTASEVIAAAGRRTSHISEELDKSARTLSSLADDLEEAKIADAGGRGQLQYAQQLLRHSAGTLNYDDDKVKQAHHSAMAGIDALAKASAIAESAGKGAARALRQSASTAHSGHVGTSSLTPADIIVAADAAVPGGPNDLNLILTGGQCERAVEQLDRLSAEDRSRIDALLANAKSPQERAYILKALAAGYGANQIADFASKIHAHGDDPTWLRDHLTPIVEDGNQTQNGHHDLWYEGNQWTQGQHPTCGASSIVTARAQLDPLYALELTTGGHPDDPAYDNGAAFANRLLAEQDRVYDSGRNWFDRAIGSEGMSDGQANSELDKEIGNYRNVDINSAADRRAVLPEIEKAVEDGSPVLLGVRQGLFDGHFMMIIGHDGGMLEIYNPWGYTVWVSEEQFVNGQLDDIEKGVPSTPESIHLPR